MARFRLMSILIAFLVPGCVGGLEEQEQRSGAARIEGVLSAEPSAKITTSSVHSQLGTHLAAGDVDGDGFEDLLVAGNFMGSDVGLHLGGPDGIAVEPAVRFIPEQGSSGFGTVAVTDVDKDGKADVIIGASGVHSTYPIEAGTQIYLGRLYVYKGRSRREPTVQDLSGMGAITTPVLTITGDAAHAMLGRSVAAAGDVNGDGFGDVLAESNQRVLVFLGSATGLSATPATSVTVPNPGYFGRSIAGAGDVDGDGCDDVVIGEPDLESGGGRALLYGGTGAACHGSKEGLAAEPIWTSPAGIAVGEIVAAAGDVNGDGYADVAVANDTSSGGAAYVFLGSAQGLAAQPAWTVRGLDGDSLVISLVGADFNKDGLSDLVVATSGTDEFHYSIGGAHLFLGTTDSAGLMPDESWSARSTGSILTAGRFNGDEHPDLAVGMPQTGGWQYAFGAVYVYDGSAGRTVTDADVPFPTDTVLNDKPFSTAIRTVARADAGGCHVLRWDVRFNYTKTDQPEDSTLTVRSGRTVAGSRWQQIEELQATRHADGWHAELTVEADSTRAVQFVFRTDAPGAAAQWDNGGVGAMSYYELELPAASCGAPEVFRTAYPRIGY